MYDFYARPPQTKRDIREFLTSWLVPPTEQVAPIEVNGEKFIQLSGFRRAFHLHSVNQSLTTNKYVWWVYEVFDINTFPTKRYDTYEELLKSVIDDYYTAWNSDELNEDIQTIMST